MPPAVQSLEELYAQLNPAYQGTRDLVGAQLSAVPGQFQAQETALGVKKDNSFRDINTGANAKGLAFSGIPIAEQTRYLGEQYLPAVAGLESQKNNATLELQKVLASLDQEQRLRAIDRRTDQQKALDAYLENERQRAQQLQMQREQIAASSSRGGGSDRAPTAAEMKAALAGHIQEHFGAYVGKDGRVGTGTWNSALNDWTGNGGNVKDFWKNWGRFVNPKFKKSYAGYNQR